MLFFCFLYGMLESMKETEEHIALLRYMSSILRERKGVWMMSETQRELSDKGILALDRAVEALRVQVYA
jgi:hypothetical protein